MTATMRAHGQRSWAKNPHLHGGRAESLAMSVEAAAHEVGPVRWVLLARGEGGAAVGVLPGHLFHHGLRPRAARQTGGGTTGQHRHSHLNHTRHIPNCQRAQRCKSIMLPVWWMYAYDLHELSQAVLVRSEVELGMNARVVDAVQISHLTGRHTKLSGEGKDANPIAPHSHVYNHQPPHK